MCTESRYKCQNKDCEMYGNILQTNNAHLENLPGHFGAVVCDECGKVGSLEFIEV